MRWQTRFPGGPGRAAPRGADGDKLVGGGRAQNPRRMASRSRARGRGGLLGESFHSTAMSQNTGRRPGRSPEDASDFRGNTLELRDRRGISTLYRQGWSPWNIRQPRPWRRSRPIRDISVLWNGARRCGDPSMARRVFHGGHLRLRASMTKAKHCLRGKIPELSIRFVSGGGRAATDVLQRIRSAHSSNHARRWPLKARSADFAAARSRQGVREAINRALRAASGLSDRHPEGEGVVEVYRQEKAWSPTAELVTAMHGIPDGRHSERLTDTASSASETACFRCVADGSWIGRMSRRGSGRFGRAGPA